MKIVVINAYVRENAGDAALLSVLLTQLDGAFPGADIRVAGMEPSSTSPEFEGKVNLGSIRQWTSEENIWRPRRIARKVLTSFVRLGWYRGGEAPWKALTGLLPQGLRTELEALESADLVVGLGGGYLRGTNDLAGDLNVFYLLLPIVLAERLKTPVILAPQSYGPFASERQRKQVKAALEHAQQIFVREETSVRILSDIGVPAGKLERSVDSGFAFEGAGAKNWRQELGLLDADELIGITARRWLTAEGQAAYEQAIAGVIDEIHAGGNSRRVILIPQVMSAYQQDDDRIVQRRIAAECNPDRQPISIEQLDGHADLKDLYATLDYLIGTRFHSVIFALTSTVPCIAIEYEHKTGGIMHDLKLDEWVLKIENVTRDDLSSMFKRLVEQRDAYRKHLQDVMPDYIAQAKGFQDRLKEVYAAAR